MQSTKGYSLIEIVIGLAIIVVFLVGTGSLLNASFTNYHLILQRNEAMDFAITEMEKVLLADSVTVSDVGYQKNDMNARVKIENVREGDTVYSDKVFLVTVNVEYYNTQNSTKKQNVEIQSLKIVK